MHPWLKPPLLSETLYMSQSAATENSWNPPFVQWVVKVTKHCNLRCRYCYEYPFLGDPKHMELHELKNMFHHIANFFENDPKRMDFVWHGGEPLMLASDFYLEMEEFQHEAFDSKNIPFTNSIQTNLTLLNEQSLGLLKNFFKHIGVSIDVFGDQRVNVGGKQIQNRVLENMQILKDQHITFGCITVLSTQNADFIESIYHFFEEIDTSFRLLPIYRTGYEGQQSTLALAPEQILGVYKKAIDLWFASNSYIQVRPIQDYITHVVWHFDKERLKKRFYNKMQSEVVYIVDTEGSLYSNADAYDISLCHGNLFKDSLNVLKQSTAYLRAVNAAQDRINQTCADCKYYGSCSGYFIGEATPEQRWYDGLHRLQCSVVKPSQNYIEQILLEAGLASATDGLQLNERIWKKSTTGELFKPFEG